ncbi:MAG: GNAT family N-acetyltransferase [Peptococcaceae bacterium]|nr:GNAT family N-acetyltransferase [Peptococcaceae bacterium]
MFPEPKYIPSIEIARLAVSSSWQNGRKDNLHLGTELMKYIITFIKEEISSKVGCRFITLHALNDKVSWYSKEFCFESLADEKAENPDEETQYMCLDITDNAQREEYYEYVRKNGNN